MPHDPPSGHRFLFKFHLHMVQTFFYYSKKDFPMGQFIIAMSLHPVSEMRSLETSRDKITDCDLKDVEVSPLSKILTCSVFIFSLFSTFTLFLCTTIISFQKSMLVNRFICGNIIAPGFEPEFSFPRHAPPL